MVALDSLLRRLARRGDRIASIIFRFELFDIYFPPKLESIRIWNAIFVVAASEFFDRSDCVGRAMVELTRIRRIRSMSAVLACLQVHVAFTTVTENESSDFFVSRCV